jgi:hypothetical protein
MPSSAFLTALLNSKVSKTNKKQAKLFSVNLCHGIFAYYKKKQNECWQQQKHGLKIVESSLVLIFKVIFCLSK